VRTLESESAVLNRLGGSKSRFYPLFALFRHVAFGRFGAFAEQELFHLLLDELPVARVDRAQAVFIDQHGLVRHPFLPGLLGDGVEYSLAEFARVSLEGQTRKFLFEEGTVDHAFGHLSLSIPCVTDMCFQ